jgi:hypothetical protein
MRISIALGIRTPTMVERVRTVETDWDGAQLGPATMVPAVFVRTRPSSL